MITEDSIYDAIIEASADKVFCQKYALLTIVGNNEMSYKYYVDELEKDSLQFFPEIVEVTKYSKEWLCVAVRFVDAIMKVIQPPLVVKHNIVQKLHDKVYTVDRFSNKDRL